MNSVWQLRVQKRLCDLDLGNSPKDEAIAEDPRKQDHLVSSIFLYLCSLSHIFHIPFTHLLCDCEPDMKLFHTQKKDLVLFKG